jgi:AcrR family transcriptional regulator
MSTPEKQLTPISPFELESKCDEGACARDRIFEAAKKLFYKSGIRGVSVEAIAEEANTTKVTLYRVYSSKDELIVKVLEDQAERWKQWWDEVVSSHPGEPRKQIEAIFESFHDELCCDNAERGCAMANASVELEENHAGRQVIREHKLEMASRMRELCRQMGAKDPAQLANSLMLLLHGAFASRLVYDGREQIAAVGTAASTLIDAAIANRAKR